ncbi:MAG: glycosyltransferase [Actinobacteria bacterium]|nr:glycosyltransferase [Actinomycetota bacterium]
MDFRVELPTVSVIIPNFNGRDYLDECLKSIFSARYPHEKLEVIVVDNASTDGSIDFVKKEFPDVKIIANDKNMGFAPAINIGAGSSKGECLVIMNNDLRVHEDWLIELVAAISSGGEVGCAGSLVLNRDGDKIDFAGGVVNFEGKGFQIGYDEKVDDYLSKLSNSPYPRYLFVNGSSFIVRSSLFDEVGGMDEDFFAYYDDIDFGWRIWLAGYCVVLAPKSVVYHRHHGTSDRFAHPKIRYLMEKNSLSTIYKNYSDENLGKVMFAALLNIVNRIVHDRRAEVNDFLIGTKEREDQKNKSYVLTAEEFSSLAAISGFLQNLPGEMEKRGSIQASRKRDDGFIFSLFKAEHASISPDKKYQDDQVQIQRAAGIYPMFDKDLKRKILIISNEVISDELAGPGIRAWNVAETLSKEFFVRLAVPNKTDLKHETFEIVRLTQENFGEFAHWADVVMVSGTIFARYEGLKYLKKPLIVDLYDPYNIATLIEQRDKAMNERLKSYEEIKGILMDELYHGDFFICANERQRDYWIGMLTTIGRVNPVLIDYDPSLRRFIDLVPFGLPSYQPVRRKSVIKGIIPGIDSEDFIVIWGGGIYNWLDPITMIRAMKIVAEKNSRIKLFFLGVNHPNPEVKEKRMVNEAVNLAKSLELEGKSVFFNYGWVPYDKRADYLLDCDVGVISHFKHLETRFSFRTRLLDYIWAGLPIVTTGGDSLSELVRDEGIGLVVSEESPQEMAQAILQLAGNRDLVREFAQKCLSIADMFTWEKVCKPLIEYCRDPVMTSVKSEVSKSSSQKAQDRSPSILRRYIGAVKREGFIPATRRALKRI